MQKYAIDIDKRDIEIRAVKQSLAEVSSGFEKAVSEKDFAMKKIHEVQFDSTAAFEKYKSLLMNKDIQMNEFLEKSSEKIKAIRDQYENDRSRMQIQINELQGQKAVLQTEISQMVRARNEKSVELVYVSRYFSLFKNTFHK